MSKLTDKCKEDFEKYVLELKVAPYISMLYDIPECYLNSLIIEFFDSVGININVEPYFDFNRRLLFSGYIVGARNINEQNPFLDRQSALNNIIKLTNKYYNEKV